MNTAHTILQSKDGVLGKSERSGQRGVTLIERDRKEGEGEGWEGRERGGKGRVSERERHVEIILIVSEKV